MSVLSAADVDQFVELGWCRLPGACSEAQAAVVRDAVWERMAACAGIRREDPSTWPEFYNLEEHLRQPEVVASFTDRLAAGIEQLEGPGRWAGYRQWGLWPVNFRLGAGQPYAVPSWGWHIDGNWFRHTLDCPRQGLLVIGLFSDVEPGGGGTLLAQGSHQRTARILATRAGGMTHQELFQEVLQEPIGDLVEATGATGDALLVHPFLFHTRNMNHSGRIRFMSNTEAPLKEPMRFERPAGDYSVLETSIKRALVAPPRRPVVPLQACW